MSIVASMETLNDCGPEAMRRALNAAGYKMSIVDVKRVWDWQNYGGIREDLQDSPWHHLAVLRGLNIKRKLRSCVDILSGTATPEKTVILIRNPENSIFGQHWVVLKSVSASGVFLHWGNDTVKSLPITEFKKWFEPGKISYLSPACAYEIGVGDLKLSFFERLYVWLFNKFC